MGKPFDYLRAWEEDQRVKGKSRTVSDECGVCGRSKSNHAGWCTRHGEHPEDKPAA